MKGCRIRKGFFTLRPCGDRAAAACPECKRPICRRHLHADGLCVECSADHDDDDWNEGAVYDYRDDYWEDESYEPASAEGYNESDAAAFAAAAAAGDDFDFGDEGGLLDS